MKQPTPIEAVGCTIDADQELETEIAVEMEIPKEVTVTRIRFAFRVLAAVVALAAQLTVDQKVQDFRHLAGLYATSYVGHEWKRDVIGFDLMNIELAAPFGGNTLDERTLLYVREKLAGFERCAWGGILDSKHNHNVGIQRLCKSAQGRAAASNAPGLNSTAQPVHLHA